MISRLGSEYFMPAWPMAMPSSTPMVLKTNGTPPACADALLDELADLVEMDVAGDDVDVAVADGDERLAEIVVGHAGGAEQAAVRSAGIAQFDNVGAHIRNTWSFAK